MKINPHYEALKNQYKYRIFAPLFTKINTREGEKSSLFISRNVQKNCRELIAKCIKRKTRFIFNRF